MNTGLELSPINVEEKQPNVFLSLRMNHIINGQPCSLRKLSKLMNNAVGFSHMCELESGKTPSLAELIAYSDYFHVSIDYLLGRADCTSGCNDSGVNNSFNELVTSLYSSKDTNDRQMLDTLNYIIGTDAGRVLLFYLSKFVLVDGEMNSLELCTVLDAWKKVKGKGVLSYQEIMLIISNILESEVE